MFKLKAMIPALLGLVLVAGCGPGNPMVGTWKLEMSEEIKKLSQGQPDAGNISMTFKDDNTVTMNSVGGGKTENATGTYTLAEKTLKIKMKPVAGTAIPEQEQTFTLSEDNKSFDMSILGKMVKQ